MRVNELNNENLGARLIGLGLSARLANHSYPKDNARDYLDHSIPEIEFISDMLNLKTEEIIEKWYDGDDSAFAAIMERS